MQYQGGNMNTEKILKLVDGTKAKLTLTYGKLYKLQNKNPEIVEEYLEIQKKDSLNEFEILKTIYVAYLCADNDNNISFEEFLNKVPSNRRTMMEIYVDLLYPKN